MPGGSKRCMRARTACDLRQLAAQRLGDAGRVDRQPAGGVEHGQQLRRDQPVARVAEGRGGSARRDARAASRRVAGRRPRCRERSSAKSARPPRPSGVVAGRRRRRRHCSNRHRAARPRRRQRLGAPPSACRRAPAAAPAPGRRGGLGAGRAARSSRSSSGLRSSSSSTKAETSMLRELQQLDGLPQLRRHHQRLRLPQVEAGAIAMRGPARGWPTMGRLRGMAASQAEPLAEIDAAHALMRDDVVRACPPSAPGRHAGYRRGR